VFSKTAILNNGGYNSEWANSVGGSNSGTHGTVAEWFNTSAFANPAPYTYGNEVPNSLVTNWGKNVDISLFRKFRIGLGETRFFELRAEAYNVFNNVIFGIPNNNLGNPNPGQVTGVAGASLPRQLQMGMKFYF
jgi:hypothetical protein